MDRWVAGAAVVASALAIGSCDRDPPSPVGSIAKSPCVPARGDKLGVPFVRVCPSDLPGAFDEPFWIAAAPIGCSGGEHETIGCPPIVALSSRVLDDGAPRERTAQLVDAVVAHRTCTMRFGGRLATSSELGSARAALGLVAIAVIEVAGEPRRHPIVPEWATERPCLDPSTLAASCEPTRIPAGRSAALPWEQLVACRARPSQLLRATEPDQPCPDRTPCAIELTPLGSVAPSRVEVECHPLDPTQRVHPAEATALDHRAAFRCVVPQSALVGTIH